MSTFKERVSRISRRRTHDPNKSVTEGDLDDNKKFPLILERYCDERLYPYFPEIRSCVHKQDGDLFEVEHILIPEKTAVEDQEQRIIMHLNADFKLSKLQCITTGYIDTRMFYAFGQTFAHFNTLSCLQLDYCHLTADHIVILNDSLKAKKGIIELSLVGNPVKQEIFSDLIHCGLKVLILKFCRISKKGLRRMALEFLHSAANSSLIHLDLSHNMIFDEGCKYISGILRCDRVLRSLNLTDCGISDDGFKVVLSSFGKFALKDEELFYRRKIRMEYFRSQQKVPEYPVKKKLPKEDSEGNFEDIQSVLNSHPFTNEESVQENGEVYCIGNNSLENLNISYNQLTKSGLDLLVKTLLEQTNPFGYKGLQSVNIEGNPYRKETDGIVVEKTIEHLLLTKKLHSESYSIKSRTSSMKKRKSSASNSVTSTRSKERPSTVL